MATTSLLSLSPPFILALIIVVELRSMLMTTLTLNTPAPPVCICFRLVLLPFTLPGMTLTMPGVRVIPIKCFSLDRIHQKAARAT